MDLNRNICEVGDYGTEQEVVDPLTAVVPYKEPGGVVLPPLGPIRGAGAGKPVNHFPCSNVRAKDNPSTECLQPFIRPARTSILELRPPHVELKPRNKHEQEDEHSLRVARNDNDSRLSAIARFGDPLPFRIESMKSKKKERNRQTSSSTSYPSENKLQPQSLPIVAQMSTLDIKTHQNSRERKLSNPNLCHQGNPMFVQGRLAGKHSIPCLLDTSAKNSTLAKTVIQKFNLGVAPPEKVDTFGETLRHHPKSELVCSTYISVGRAMPIFLDFEIDEESKMQCVLGQDFFTKSRVVLNFVDKCLEFESMSGKGQIRVNCLTGDEHKKCWNKLKKSEDDEKH